MSTLTIDAPVQARVVCNDKRCPDGTVQDGDGVDTAAIHNDLHHRGAPEAHAELVAA